MFFGPALWIVSGLGVLGFVQAVVVWRYGRWMRQIGPASNLSREQRMAEPTDTQCAVVMSVRGHDLGLRETLLAHLQQDYGDYRLHVVVDSEQDASLPVIRNLPAAVSERLEVHFLKRTSDRCGLKCLALAQVCENLLESPQPPRFFAFADSDGLVSRDWLSRLLFALHRDEPQPLATNGHRWYHADPALLAGVDLSEKLGTMVRFIWNLGSLPQMHLYQVAWGGSWAIRAGDLRRSQLIQSWRVSLFEDTMIQSHLEKINGQVLTVPGLYVQSRDTISWNSARSWIARQLLDLRLYHAKFPWVAGHAFASLVINALAIIYCFDATFLADADNSNTWNVAMVFAAMCLYQVSYLWMWSEINATVEFCFARLNFSNPPGDESTLASEKKHPTATAGDTSPKETNAIQTHSSQTGTGQFWSVKLGTMLLTQVAYPVAMWQAIFQKRTVWRNIEYEIISPFEIRRQDTSEDR